MVDSGLKVNSPLIAAAIWVLFVILIAPVLGNVFSSLQALVILSFLYWGGCWLLALRFADRKALADLYHTPINRRPITLLLTWLPPVATFVIVFWPSAPQLSFVILLIVFGVAILNGATEELFWRGVFISRFSSDIRMGLFEPLLLFVLWHIALLLIPGIHYQGGAPALLGGALYMGLSWGWVVWHTRDLRSVSIAHVLTNLFAFSGLILDNGFN
jgi:membrane protease YdiL (CAAX protease family)